MKKYIMLIGIMFLIGQIYIINQGQVNETRDYTARFLKFKAKFGKRYGSNEETYRLAVFTDNMIQADLHNAKPESTFTMGETQFADLKQQEFIDIYLSKVQKKVENQKQYQYPIFDGPKTYPAAFDWRKYPGVTSKVKNQGYCGSCWAFSAASEVEAYFAVKKGVLNLDLSEQQLVDCDKEDDQQGCLGGNENYALEYIAKYGITTEEVYPYIGQDGICQNQFGPYQINGFRQVEANDNALKSALSVQPVTVGVESSNWYLYTGGIFNQCNSGGPIDHAVIAVGYDANSWIIKNSWGTGWGENGYIRLNCNYVLQYIFVAV